MPPAPDETEHFDPIMLEDRKARTPVRRVLLAGLGVLCMGLGVVGWLVPVITGVPFYVAGLLLLGKASPWFAHQINRLEAHLPVKLRRALRWRPGRRAHESAAPTSPETRRGRDGSATPASPDAENERSQIKE